MHKKILITLLTHSNSIDRLKTCLQTWCKSIKDRHELIILGDSQMEDNFSGFEVFKALEKECYTDLPFKIFKSFSHCLSKDWDFLVKIDDDAYLSMDRLESFLMSEGDSLSYCGSPVIWENNKIVSNHINRLNSYPDQPQSFPKNLWKNGNRAYAQGGCYILSRKALSHSIKYFDPENAVDSAEDAMVGKALFLSDLAFQNRPDLFLNNNATDFALNWFIKHNYLSFHKVNSDKMEKLHKLYDHEK